MNLSVLNHSPFLVQIKLFYTIGHIVSFATQYFIFRGQKQFENFESESIVPLRTLDHSDDISVHAW